MTPELISGIRPVDVISSMSIHAEKARWIHAREKRLNWQVRSFLNSLPAHARVDSTTERDKETKFYFDGIKYNEREVFQPMHVWTVQLTEIKKKTNFTSMELNTMKDNI